MGSKASTEVAVSVLSQKERPVIVGINYNRNTKTKITGNIPTMESILSYWGSSVCQFQRERKMLKTSKEWQIEVTEYTDPYCTWCWGSEPILRKIKAEYGDQIKISFIMGGLVENIDRFFDPSNRIGGSKWHEQVAAHWEEASGKHGMPVDSKAFLKLKTEGFRSTYPANIAYKAAQIQDQGLADKFLRRLREAASAEGKIIHRIDVQVELAEEVGLDGEKYIQAIENGAAEKEFRNDVKICRGFRITGFPTYQIKNRDGKGLFLNGYQGYQSFERVFQKLNGGSLKKTEYSLKEEDILSFIKKFEKVATQEVATLLGIERNKANKFLSEIESITPIEVGNDYFWAVK